MHSNNNQLNKLKVLLAAPLPPPDHGGIANWTRIIRAELGKNPNLDLRFVDTTARYRAVTNQSLAVRLVGGSVQALRDTWRIYRQMKKYRPHLLHLCTSAGPATLKDWLILRISKWLQIPSVIHYRMGRLPDIAKRAGAEWQLIRRAVRLADVVLPLDKNSEASIRNAIPQAKVVKIPNMVEIDDIDRISKTGSAPPNCSQGCIRLVFAGHVIPTKGLRELVLACARLPDYNLLLDIIGPVSAGFLQELQQIASTAKNGDWMRCLGSVDHEETVRHIASAEIFVLPSYTEGMPNVVLEAMACQRAIIAAAVGAVPEMLDIGGPQECGVCVPPRNVDALAQAIRRLADEPQLRRQLGLKARQRVEQLYCVPVGCEQLVNVWLSVSRRKLWDVHQSQS